MYKVLVTETVHEVGPNLLAANDCQLVFANRDMDIIRKEIVDADAVFVRIIDLDRALLSTAKKLKIVSKHGVGVDNIDLDYCKEAGIMVTVTPTANSMSVAEHAFTLMMALAKNLIPVTNEYRDVGFAAKNHAPGVEITGKTIAVVGLGRIGSRIAKMCYGGFNMKVLAYDPYVKEAPEGVTLVPTLDEALSQADVVTLHAALTPETRGLIGTHEFEVMKDGVIFVNCARGPMVDEDALIAALQSGHVAGAGLDVTAAEPCDPESVLFKMPNVLLTPHYAPATVEAATAVSRIAAENILNCFAGKEIEGRLI